MSKVALLAFAAVFAGLGLSACGSGSVEESSDSAPTAVPTVSLAANPTSVTSGGNSMLAWSSTNATSCSASGAWSGAKATAGNQSTGALNASGNYSLTCSGSEGSASASATVTVPGTPPPPPVPTVSLAANPKSVTSGTSSTLTWSSTNATSCTASGGWSGAKATAGSESSGALTSTTQFSLACTGPDGTGNASATVSVLPPPGPVPAWVNALALGQWYEIPNTKMSSLPNEIGGGWAKVAAWTSFVADPRTSKVYSVANGGHGDYSGNEVDALELERDDPRWVEVLARTPQASYTGCSEYYADGRPTARHTYYGVTIDEFNDRIMLFGGVWSCGIGLPSLSTIDSYNIGGNSYSPSGTHPRLPAPFNNWWINYTANPLTGDVYAITTGGPGRWNRSSNTFTASLGASGSVSIGGYTMSAFDTTRGRIYAQGGDDRSHHIYTLSNNTWTTVTVTGANAGNVANLSQGAMIYVPALDAYLVRALPSGGTVYRIDASTFVATTLATTNGSGVPATMNGPFNKFLYVPRLGGAVYVPDYGSNAWFLRLH